MFRKKYVQPKAVPVQSRSLPKEVVNITSQWKVSFDSAWGGPAKPTAFNKLEDWSTNADAGIRYYSGTAVYTTVFNVDMPLKKNNAASYHLDLGIVKNIAAVTLNGKKLKSSH